MYLGELELPVLLAIVRLGGDAYGVTIREEIGREAARELTLGAIYETLGRLDQGSGERALMATKPH